MALYAPATNAAFMLHQEARLRRRPKNTCANGRSNQKEKAARTVAFLTDPSSRAYVSAYADGRRLCSDFAKRAPGTFTRLLTEQLTSADLSS
jgi:hypothetical protein